jgi:hypothetical protein
MARFSSCLVGKRWPGASREYLKEEGALGRWPSTREAERPLSTIVMDDLWGSLRQGPLRSKVQGRGTLLSRRKSPQRFVLYVGKRLEER